MTILTVAPVRDRDGERVDLAAAGVAMSVAPYVGAALGCVLAGVGLASVVAGASPLVAAVVTIGAGALLTRGLHLDGLADTVDGLGSYAAAERALTIMRGPQVGAFGVAAVCLALLAQVAGATSVLARPWPAALAGIVAATAAGRLAITTACRRGVPAARADGLGALVAGTVRWPALVVGGAVVLAVAVPAVPGAAWQGPVAVIMSAAAAALLVRHAVRRLGGITGDILGAANELGVMVAYLIISM